MSSPSHVRIELAPKPGFCVKIESQRKCEPAGARTGPIPVAKGLKVFVNIAWDANVPPPPEGSEDAIQRAMQGEDVDEENPSGWYVPVIVSNARQDKDKAGNSSLVFDCIYNTTVKSRTLRDPEFKVFLVELALQRIEAQTGLALSRNIGTPNISSKGKLLPRTVQVPSALLPALTGAPSSSSLSSSKSTANAPKLTGSNAPLIQEISTDERAANGSTRTHTGSAHDEHPLDWSWTKDDASRLRIDVNVPGLTHTLIQSSTLDIEARRLTLSVPNRCALDIDLAVSDAEIVARISSAYASSVSASVPVTASAKAKAKAVADADERDKRKEAETTRTLQLKRQRDFDVDGAEAEWKVASGTVVIYV
ncbi:pre-RNA processing PIH1/Nop17-domain-containing protein [Flammula alnicola]|nr:pre-RNA processing PIH1/Nop17-domain-containing protein [Flammula alnicola]